MTADLDIQYRVVSTRETSADDGLSVRGVRDLAVGANNLMRCWGGICATIFPGGVLSKNNDANENVVLVFVGRYIPDGFYHHRWSIGHQRTVGAGTVTWRIYATSSLYQGPEQLDKTLLSPWYTTGELITNTGTHEIATCVDGARVPLSRLFRKTPGFEYALITAENSDGTTRAKLTGLTISPQTET